MVSGLTGNGPTEEQNASKTKKKFVFAKDRKQAMIAILVTIMFIANSIHMIVKFIMEQKMG